MKEYERWWGTGTNHSSLLSELDNCSGLLDGSDGKMANDYLSDLYANLNINSEKGDLAS